MIKSILKVLMLFIISLLVSCQSSKKAESNIASISVPPISIPQSSLSTECKSPRSPMCTREYKPVCATRDTGVRCVTTPCPSTELVTKSNACTACADEKVFSYIEGACN